MLWILYCVGLFLSFFGIFVGGNNYKRTHKYSDLFVCCTGCGLLAFTLMLGAVLIFVV